MRRVILISSKYMAIYMYESDIELTYFDIELHFLIRLPLALFAYI